MSFKGLFNVYRNALNLLKESNGLKQALSNIKTANKLINKGVLKEGGRLASIFQKVGFWGGFWLPFGSIYSPITGAAGAFAGKALSEGGKAGIKLTKKCISIFL